MPDVTPKRGLGASCALHEAAGFTPPSAGHLAPPPRGDPGQPRHNRPQSVSDPEQGPEARPITLDGTWQTLTKRLVVATASTSHPTRRRADPAASRRSQLSAIQRDSRPRRAARPRWQTPFHLHEAVGGPSLWSTRPASRRSWGPSSAAAQLSSTSIRSRNRIGPPYMLVGINNARPHAETGSGWPRSTPSHRRST